jgi:hypothetical protein
MLQSAVYIPDLLCGANDSIYIFTMYLFSVEMVCDVMLRLDRVVW